MGGAIRFHFAPHGIRLGAWSSLPQQVIRLGWLKTTGETLYEEVVVRQYPQPNARLLAGNDAELDWTDVEDDIELKTEAEGTKLLTIAKVQDILVIWWG